VSEADSERRRYRELRYLRVTDDRGRTLRGTIHLLDDQGNRERDVPGFPHINRVYRLVPGVKHLFSNCRFFAEEKLDGYNTRIFLHGGRCYAATRGRFICPFSTEWAQDWHRRCLRRFFEIHPRLVLCAEITGDNPYNNQRDPTLGPGAHMHVFDILDPGGGFLPPEKRYELVDRFHLPAVRRFGQFSRRRIGGLEDILRALNERGREGVVLKSADGKKAVKYVTPASDLEDVRDGLVMEFDLHHRYFRNRVLRAALFMQDFNMDQESSARLIGEAFLRGYRSLAEFREAAEHYVIYLRRRETWDELLELIGSRVRVYTESVEKSRVNEEAMLRIRFRRVFPQSTHRYHSILKGFPHID
jgi:putative ATP-dependent DNA ligase